MALEVKNKPFASDKRTDVTAYCLKEMLHLQLGVVIDSIGRISFLLITQISRKVVNYIIIH